MANLQIVLSTKTVEAQYVEMRVPLYSYGCEKKVKRALSHLRGIYSVNVDFNQQKVTVWGICNKHDVLTTMRKKRKGACFWNPEDNNVVDIEMEESQPPTPPSPPSLALRRSLQRSFTLEKARSLTLKAWKRVFIRSNSF
ncbi:heavy metal-associated isoprenylated plant protein 28-like [Camellia sinensis]|uniref:HMA domain-containing protein n=1 Tax=Camellia sinensis var. sinensis TaxID=542762 RepID=A0A4S4EVJ5_CAMSN|nr:heavy metal-associated isoprenylated plant protein 28-like [Camellia sinensis]THG20991.1 hypothetical protein TEA_029867 [Camellia sinensis var. sinensis]